MARKRRIYEPLSKNEFRILILKPGRHDDLVRCKLKVHSLDNEPLIPYETISYVWGDPRAQRRIFLDGRAVHVPISTKQAIQCMRLPTEQRALWIDAVCINQKDLDERSRQVALMGRIYSCGIRNLIYLGNDPEHLAKTVFNTIEAATVKIATAMSLGSDRDQQRWRIGLGPNSWKTSPPFIEADVMPLEQLFERPWFTRLWVMQEACLAKENLVCFGNMKCDLGQLLDICFVIVGASGGRHPWSDEAYNGSRTLFWLRTIINDIHASGVPLDGYDVFILARRLATKERHDRVFAVRDMLIAHRKSHKISDLLAVDYRKPVGAVFRDATIYELMNSREDRILNQICHKEGEDMFSDGRTSWTAPWDQELDRKKDSSGFRRLDMSAGLLDLHYGSALEVETAERNDSLAIKSLIFAEPLEITTPRGNFYGDNSDVLRSILETVGTLMKSNSTSGDSNYETAVDILTGGWWHQEFNDLGQAAQALKDLRGRLQDDKSSSSPGSQLELYQDFRESIANNSSNRCFFAMSCGLAGSGPKILRAGDVVAVAIGANLPWVIRPSGRDDGSYYFIGTAYIPGLNKGEVFEMGLKEEVIILR